MTPDRLNAWRITGLVATLAIILTLPLYRFIEGRRAASSAGPAMGATAAFVGSQACRDCHKQQYDKWKGSHHERAMDVATEQAVLGDFGDAVFEHLGVTSRFFRRDGKFFVRTAGPGGEMGDFEITHTFGWYPLQQYLIPFPGGRLQCLPLAWDVRARRWYHLYPDQRIDPRDWLYWTNNAQNWNAMCAECHSTDLRKNYDPIKDTYQTAWSEINVGCEACHGPGSDHVSWAELPEMGRPETPDAALTVRTSKLGARQQIELCAPCHSRRMSLGDNIHRHADFLDYGIPQLLTEGLYFADGQILDEVYVYGSFMQSKMYDRQVRCSDCHDVHAIKRIKKGNDLCLQCHKAALYDTKAHHFHKSPGEAGEPIQSPSGDILFEVGSGAQCEQCHMPGRNYMGIDYRPDHSFRIPQPELSRTIGSPNACNRCHVDKTVEWSLQAIEKWYGSRKRSHYGAILASGRAVDPEALHDLEDLARDRLYPDIVRATALRLLGNYPGTETAASFTGALADEAALLRHTAVRNLPEADPNRRLRVLGPLLYDAVKAVRMEAAAGLAGIPETSMAPDLRPKYQTALDEYRQAMERTADFAPSRHNLGNLYHRLGKIDQAIGEYRKAISIDDQFYPAKVNLANLYNQRGRNEAAEQLLQQVLAAHPDLHAVKYSLGLLLAEMGRADQAADYLRQAAEAMPQRHRIRYNLGLLRQHLGQDAAAETELQAALALAPDNPDYLYALAVFYFQRRRWDAAEKMARHLAAGAAAKDQAGQLLEAIQKARQASDNNPRRP
jgi:tetratricopeptide (TPR) repeat protein